MDASTGTVVAKSPCTLQGSVSLSRLGTRLSRRSTHPTTSLEDLPIELITLVVRSLRDDGRALGACASLNKAWRKFCLPHLLERIVIKHSQPNRNVLLGFLMSIERWEHVRIHIKELALDAPSADAPLVVESLDLFARILSSLPHLRTLTLRHVWFKKHDTHLAQRSVSQWVATRVDRVGPYPLQTLICDACAAGNNASKCNPNVFFTALAFFRVRTLVFRGFQRIGRAQEEWDPGSRYPRQVEAENLVLRPAVSKRDTQTFVDALRARMTANAPLRSLTLVDVAGEHIIAAAGDLIREKGRELVNFSLDVTRMAVHDLDDNPQLWTYLNLGLCANLASLTFYLVVQPPAGMVTPENAGPGLPLSRALARLLRTVPNALRMLTIFMQVKPRPPETSSMDPAVPANVQVPPASELAVLSDFPTIARLLTRASSNVERVRVVIYTDEGVQMREEDREAWVVETTALLPRLKANGALCVEHGRPPDPYSGELT
ncbi:hypothetical protein C8Q77DRAFT_1074941 [Trametes polyzona]|nr:hypothetical protein C8Q77DRAFT_1074941 [Trametes polyzona]